MENTEAKVSVLDWKSTLHGASRIAASSVLAYGITAAAMPFIARQYGPDSFGLAAAWFAIASILSSAACLRYDTAVSLPHDDRSALSVAMVALLVSASVSAVLAAALIVLWCFKVRAIWGVPIGYALWLPVGVIVLAWSAVFTQWLARLHEVRSLANIKILSSGATAAIQLGLASFGGAGSLIAGEAAGRALGVAARAKTLVRAAKADTSAMRSDNVWQSFLQYRRHALWLTPTALLDAAGAQIPLLLMIAWYGDDMGGRFSLAQRLFSLPVALIGQSVGQLFLPIMARAFHSSSRQAYDLFLRITGVLAVPSFLLAAGVVFLDWDWLVAFLGEDWRGLQAFVKPLALLMGMQIVVSTVSQTAIVLGGQKWFFAWVVSWVALSLVGQWIGHELGGSTGAIWGMAVAKCAMYVALWLGMFILLRISLRRNVTQRGAL